jgi:hypothetical protein
MPSHIFIRLGLWQEAISSNLDAHAVAKGFAVRNHMAGAWDEQLHAKAYYGKLLQLARATDSARPELAEAKMFLAPSNH